MENASGAAQTIVFEDVSKFYGEILGVNRVNLSIGPGITSLVGPNGSGKTTLMNLLTGLITPTQGHVRVFGVAPSEPERMFHKIGYCAQFDSFPRGATGREFVSMFLRLHGFTAQESNRRTEEALARVSLMDAADRKVAGYSKGMRQRARLAQAIAHTPQVLVLDEPLNGLDPMARAEIIRLFQDLAAEGLYLIISSHILHEVDMLSDRVVLVNNGYILAEGAVTGVREEIPNQPLQILVRCAEASHLGAQAFLLDSVTEIRRHVDQGGLFVKTTQPDEFYALLQRAVVAGEVTLETVQPVDEDLGAVYQYLIGTNTEGARN